VFSLLKPEAQLKKCIEYLITVAMRYKAYICGRLIAGIPDSNPGEGMDVRL
jgi:hypothetical protein